MGIGDKVKNIMGGNRAHDETAAADPTATTHTTTPHSGPGGIMQKAKHAIGLDKGHHGTGATTGTTTGAAPGHTPVTTAGGVDSIAPTTGVGHSSPDYVEGTTPTTGLGTTTPGTTAPAIGGATPAVGHGTTGVPTGTHADTTGTHTGTGHHGGVGGIVDKAKHAVGLDKPHGTHATDTTHTAGHQPGLLDKAKHAIGLDKGHHNTATGTTATGTTAGMGHTGVGSGVGGTGNPTSGAPGTL